MRERDRERQRDRETERERQTEKERQTERDRQTDNESVMALTKDNRIYHMHIYLLLCQHHPSHWNDDIPETVLSDVIFI